MKFVILVCIMSLTVGTFASCPSPPTGPVSPLPPKPLIPPLIPALPNITGLITLLTTDLSCVTNAITALSSDPCFGNILGLILTVVTGLVTGLAGILGGLIGTITNPNGLLSTPTSNEIDRLVSYTCQLVKYIPANTTSIQPAICILLNCLIKLVLDLLCGLISLIAGLLSTLLGSILNAVLSNNLTKTLTTLVGQLTKFVGCLVTLTTVTCLHNTLCNVKSTVGCIVAELTAVGVNASALNAAVAKIAPLTCP